MYCYMYLQWLCKCLNPCYKPSNIQQSITLALMLQCCLSGNEPWGALTKINFKVLQGSLCQLTPVLRAVQSQCKWPHILEPGRSRGERNLILNTLASYTFVSSELRGRYVTVRSKFTNAHPTLDGTIPGTSTSAFVYDSDPIRCYITELQLLTI